MTIYKTKRTDMMFIYRDLSVYPNNTMIDADETFIVQRGVLKKLINYYTFKFGR